MTRAAKTAPLDVVNPPAPVVWELTGSTAMELVRQIRAVAIAASTDDARRVLTGVHVVSNGKLRMEATDSYRLHRLEVGGHLPPVTALVPAAFLARHLPKRIGLADTLRLTFGDTRFTIEFDDETYSCALIGGDYPNTDAIVDHTDGEGHEFVTAYNSKYLVDIYKAASMLSDRYNQPPVRVMSGLNPMKPTRFEVHHDGAVLTMILMPVRVP